jgi:hypothetical protein
VRRRRPSAAHHHRIITEAPVFWAVAGRFSNLDAAKAILDAGDGDPLLLARAASGYSSPLALRSDDDEVLYYSGSAIERFESLGERGTADPFYGLALLAPLLTDDSHADPDVFQAKTDKAAAWWARHDGPGRMFIEYARAWNELYTGDLPSARARLALAREQARATGNEFAVSMTLFGSGIMSMHAREWIAARQFYEESIVYLGRLRHKLWLQWALDHIALACVHLEDLDAARAYAEEGIAVSRASGLVGQGNYGSLLSTLGAIESFTSRDDQAALYKRESLAIARQNRDRPHTIAMELAVLAATEAVLGNIEVARVLVREGLELALQLEPVRLDAGMIESPPVPPALDAVSMIAGDVGEPEVGLKLRAVANRIRSEQGDILASLATELAERRVASLRAALETDVADAASAAGAAMALDDAIAEARRILDRA